MWEIYAYQNADSLFGIFNAAAAIHASNDYRAAVAAVAFCGFVAALIAYAFATNAIFLVLHVVIGVVFLPRAIDLITRMRAARAEGMPLPEPLLRDPIDP